MDRKKGDLPLIILDEIHKYIDLRFQSRELLNTVNRGEEVVITYRCKPCAKLVPYRKERKKIKKDELFGIWKEYEDIQNVEKYVRNLKKGRF